jgi:anti-anti-sigma factor
VEINDLLSIGEIRQAGVCVVTLARRIDSTNANDVTNRFKNLIATGEKSVVIDPGGVVYLTSAAFRALLVATGEAGRTAAKFALCRLTGHVRELFEIGGLLELFMIHVSGQEAAAQGGGK